MLSALVVRNKLQEAQRENAFTSSGAPHLPLPQLLALSIQLDSDEVFISYACTIRGPESGSTQEN